MSTKLKVTAIANCDDAVVFWKIDKAIENCWGFAIERERSVAGGGVQRIVLNNRTGFERDKPKPGDQRPSTVWPFQRFWWADHSVDTGDRVRYRVMPMIHTSGMLEADIGSRSAWTKWMQLSGEAADGCASFFNRGLVISQFMARYLEDLRIREKLATREQALALFKKNLGRHELPIRRFLAGALRDRMLELLATAKREKQHVFGALYELDDDELVGALAALGNRGHLVLANGSITPKKNESAEKARERDQNADARRTLQQAGLETHGRFISPGALGHNKFLVVANASKKPIAVWTGSTNWTKTGLCTQINNGLYVRHAAFARQYMEQWQRLRDAQNAFPPALVEANSAPKTVKVGKSAAEIWFTRAAKKVDLKAIEAVLNEARDGILFLMFQPGAAGTLGTLRNLLQKQRKLYIKGVVSTLPPENTKDEDHVEVAAYANDRKHAVGLDIVQPEGVKTPFSSWAATVTREEFLSGAGRIGFAIVHSKLIVVDPFGKPVVITGSHNFSTSASAQNDENFVIVRDNADLALEYAAHILSVYHHYRWIAFVHEEQQRKRNPQAYLREHDKWQQGYLRGEAKREIDFWVK